MAGYGSDGGFTSWLAENGYTLPQGSPSSAVLRQRGSDYIDGTYGDPLAPRAFKGIPTGGYTQERAFPRTGLLARGQSVPTDVVPPQVEKASYFAAYTAAVNPDALNSSISSSGATKREKIGDLETEYFGPRANEAVLTSSNPPVFSYIEGMLSPFLEGSALNVSLMVRSIGPKTSV